MAGERDLEQLLRNVRVSRRPEQYTVVALDEPVGLGDGVAALIAEAEGPTAVVTVDAARRRRWPVGFVAAWLTLEVHSALDAVGLTAAVSVALAAQDIPCNVLAGYHHDHVLVPYERAADAVFAIEVLAEH